MRTEGVGDDKSCDYDSILSTQHRHTDIQPPLSAQMPSLVLLQ